MLIRYSKKKYKYNKPKKVIYYPNIGKTVNNQIINKYSKNEKNS